MATILDARPAGPADFEQIREFERRIGFPLPVAYRDFLLEFNGGHPSPDAFLLRTDLGEEEDIVLCFFPIGDPTLIAVEVESIDELRTWPLHCAWDDLQNDLQNLYEMELDPPLLPIGTDGSSNYISLVLTGEQAGAVVFFDHETAETWPLASSFPGFLDSLRPRERTDYGLE